MRTAHHAVREPCINGFVVLRGARLSQSVRTLARRRTKTGTPRARLHATTRAAAVAAAAAVRPLGGVQDDHPRPADLPLLKPHPAPHLVRSSWRQAHTLTLLSGGKRRSSSDDRPGPRPAQKYLPMPRRQLPLKGLDDGAPEVLGPIVSQLRMRGLLQAPREQRGGGRRGVDVDAQHLLVLPPADVLQLRQVLRSYS